MNEIKLSLRENNEGSKSLIKNDKIPGVIYGKDSKSEKIIIDSKIINLLAQNKGFFSKIISIELNGKKENVLPKELQYHPVSDNIIHVDFMRVQENTKVTVEVPIEFLNREKCPGIKQGGVLNTVRRMVELRCNVNNIPEILKFDLISAEIGDSIKISNIELPEGVNPTITDRDFVIATLVPPTVEAEPETEKTEEGEEGEKAAEGSGDKKDEEDKSKQEKPETSEKKADKKES